MQSYEGKIKLTWLCRHRPVAMSLFRSACIFLLRCRLRSSAAVLLDWFAVLPALVYFVLSFFRLLPSDIGYCPTFLLRYTCSGCVVVGNTWLLSSPLLEASAAYETLGVAYIRLDKLTIYNRYMYATLPARRRLLVVVMLLRRRRRRLLLLLRLLCTLALPGKHAHHLLL